jgi:AcrR family transcriptional regulator
LKAEERGEIADLPAGQAERRVTEAGPVRRLRRAERRTQILDAATRASARSGFVTTSLDEVAAEAGSRT